MAMSLSGKKPTPSSSLYYASDASASPSPKQQAADIQFVNFWGTTQWQDEDPNSLPCVSNLDPLLGPLPPGAYYPLSAVEEDDDSGDTMNLGRLALQLEFSKETALAEEDELYWISQLHQCLDAGFSTFQWKRHSQGNNERIAKFRQETPPSIDTHWTLAMPKLAAGSNITPAAIRRKISALLQQTQGEVIDTLLLDYKNLYYSNKKDDNNDQLDYHLDVLDTLRDLQRDGYLRSIAIENVGQRQRLEQSQNGFGSLIGIQRQEGNLLKYPSSKRHQEDETTVSSWWTNPFCNNVLLLSNTILEDKGQGKRDGYRNRRRFVPHPMLDSNQKALIRQWVKERSASDDDDSMRYFQDQVLKSLQHLALKYQVSQRSVVLRGTLELQQQSKSTAPGSLLVPFGLSKNDGGVYNQQDDVNPQSPASSSTVTRQLQDLRKVFTVSLQDDEEDVEQLYEITKFIKKTKSSAQQDHDYLMNNIPLELLQEFGKEEIPMELLKEYIPEDDEEEEDGSSDNYPEIDFGNKALWL